MRSLLFKMCNRVFRGLGNSVFAYRVLNPDLAVLDKDVLRAHLQAKKKLEGRSASLLHLVVACLLSPFRTLLFDSHAYSLNNLDAAISVHPAAMRSHFLTVGQFDRPHRVTRWTSDAKKFAGFLTTRDGHFGQANRKRWARPLGWFGTRKGENTEGGLGIYQEPAVQVLETFCKNLFEDPIREIYRLHRMADLYRPSYSNLFAFVRSMSVRQLEVGHIVEHIERSRDAVKINDHMIKVNRVYYSSKTLPQDPFALVTPDTQQKRGVAPSAWRTEAASIAVQAGVLGDPHALSVRRSAKKALKNSDLASEFESEDDKASIGVIVSIYRGDQDIEFFVQQLEELELQSNDRIWIGVCDPSALELEVLSSLNDDRFFVEFFDERLGIYETWNRGVASLDTDYLTNMNVDDYRPPNSLMLQHEAIRQFPSADVIYAPYGYARERALPEEEWLSTMRIVMPLDFSIASILDGYNPPHNAPLWSSRLHDSFGLFDEQMRSASDAEFWIRVLMGGAKFACFRRAWSGYFDNPNGLSTSITSPATKEHDAILTDLINKMAGTSFSNDALEMIKIAPINGGPAMSIYSELCQRFIDG